MPGSDYYNILGIGQNADESELKNAFRKKAMEFHPDRNPGDSEAEAKFKEVNIAYETLKDPNKRRAYDLYGPEGVQAGGMNGAGGGFGSDFASTMSDLFEDFFSFESGTRRGSGRERGADLRFDLEITLEDSFKGHEAEIEIPTSAACSNCGGNGAKPGTEPTTCGNCGGRGRVRASQGFFTLEQTCLECQGRGKSIKDPCQDCRGTGRTQEHKTLSVNIPKGIDDGTRIRLANEGEVGFRGGMPGDLYIFVSIRPHQVFKRDGADIFCQVPVTFTTAALGGQVEVPTIEGGMTRLKVPEGTQSGTNFRMKGKGMPIMRTRKLGDMYVQVSLETPTKLNKRQIELLEEFGNLTSSKNHPVSGGFFSKVKDVWENKGK